MQVPKEWNDEPEIMELVTAALEEGIREIGDGFTAQVESRDEPNSYGDEGYIEIRTGGRRFSLHLREEL